MSTEVVLIEDACALAGVVCAKLECHRFIVFLVEARASVVILTLQLIRFLRHGKRIC